MPTIIDTVKQAFVKQSATSSADREQLKGLFNTENINEQDDSGKTALMIAVAKEDYILANFLITEGKARLDLMDNQGNTAADLFNNNVKVRQSSGASYNFTPGTTLHSIKTTFAAFEASQAATAGARTGLGQAILEDDITTRGQSNPPAPKPSASSSLSLFSRRAVIATTTAATANINAKRQESSVTAGQGATSGNANSSTSGFFAKFTKK